MKKTRYLHQKMYAFHHIFQPRCFSEINERTLNLKFKNDVSAKLNDVSIMIVLIFSNVQIWSINVIYYEMISTFNTKTFWKTKSCLLLMLISLSYITLLLTWYVTSRITTPTFMIKTRLINILKAWRNRSQLQNDRNTSTVDEYHHNFS